MRYVWILALLGCSGSRALDATRDNGIEDAEVVGTVEAVFGCEATDSIAWGSAVVRGHNGRGRPVEALVCCSVLSCRVRWL